MVLLRDRLAGSDFGWLTPMVQCPQCCYTKTEFKGTGTISPDSFALEVLSRLGSSPADSYEPFFGVFFLPS